jgi:hypothetical protein
VLLLSLFLSGCMPALLSECLAHESEMEQLETQEFTEQMVLESKLENESTTANCSCNSPPTTIHHRQ